MSQHHIRPDLKNIGCYCVDSYDKRGRWEGTASGLTKENARKEIKRRRAYKSWT